MAWHKTARWQHARHWCVALLIGTGMVVGMGTPAHALGLLEAYALATANDATFQAARASRDAGLENRGIGRAGLLPQVSLSYQNAPRNRQHIRYEASNGQFQEDDREYKSHAGSVTLTQPLFDAAAWARWKKAGAYALMADEQYRSKAQDLVLRLVKGYTGVLLAQEQLAFAHAQHDVYREQLQRNTKAFEHGDGTRTDMAQTQARLKQAEVDVITAENALEVAQLALQSMLGLQQPALPPLDALAADFADATAPELETQDFAHWQQLALTHNAELAAQRHALEAARQDVRVQKAAHLPTVRAFVQHSRNQSDIAAAYNQNYRTNTVGVVLNMPLYAGGGTAAATRQSAHLHESARHTLEAQTQTVLLELRKQHRLSQSGPTRIAASLEAMRAAELALEGNRRSVMAGERTNLDVLDAIQQMYRARRDLSNVIYETINARLELRWRTGTLDAGDLQELAAYFPSPD
ncbi:outer membrane protein, protease secretion system [Lampropedia hyalina DSM 16112]|jgi:protease secretion system outer membrane protein|uniref:Outer membrane protein, protease secretion system n=1 Tax=Lampropedia hyalina DSM 16112 TaxID=1122156 RepID=A0A1M4W0W0_9BURK|nr:TolC family outer membrane protein [Lampropedia hyalina]SHE74859.1 outer membrane protein, protease secretion system [Lampropedia hyalina DSM 16112]